MCLILCITEIVLFARRSLATITYLSFQVVKTGLWFIIFIINIVGIAGNQINGNNVNAKVLLGGTIEMMVVLYVLHKSPPFAKFEYHSSAEDAM